MTGGTTGSGATSITGTLTNTTNTTQTATYTVTPTSGTCPGATFTLTVTVNPLPVITNATTATICSGASVGLALTSTPTATTYSWIATANANVGGESTTAQSSSTISDILTNATTSEQTVTYTVTPTLNGCSGSTQSITIAVNPQAFVNAGNDQTICAGASVILAGNFGGAATNATWTGGSGSFSNSTYFPGQPDISVGIVNLYLTTNDPVGPCPSKTDTIQITINSSEFVTANITDTATVCQGQELTLAGTGDGVNYFIWSGGILACSICLVSSDRICEF
jgi:hypothetical protein